MGITQAFAGVPVRAYATAVDWYERLLGRPPDMLPTEGEAVWQLAETGWLYVVADPARAGMALLTLIVDDLEAQLAEIRERGLGPNSMEEAGAGRRAVFTDPEGNRVTLAEVNRAAQI